MRSDLPADRLHRRLGVRPDDADAEPEADCEADPDCDARALWPHWRPDSVPGRRDRWWDTVRADPGRAGAIALGALAALAVLVTVFTLIRAHPAPVVSAKLPPVQPVSTTAGRSAGPPPMSDQPVVVSVVGLVKTPGVVTLSPGARVADAVSAAGGALDGADGIGLNLARRLADGEQVVVGIAAAPGGPAAL